MSFSDQPVVGEISHFKTDPTNQGYFLVVRRFQGAFWCEAFTTLLVHNSKQETMLSRLCFTSCTFQEMLNTCKAWSSVYGREFTFLLEEQVKKLFSELEQWSPRSTLSTIENLFNSSLPDLKSGNGSSSGGGEFN